VYICNCAGNAQRTGQHKLLSFLWFVTALVQLNGGLQLLWQQSATTVSCMLCRSVVGPLLLPKGTGSMTVGTSAVLLLVECPSPVLSGIFWPLALEATVLIISSDCGFRASLAGYWPSAAMAFQVARGGDTHLVAVSFQLGVPRMQMQTLVVVDVRLRRFHAKRVCCGLITGCLAETCWVKCGYHAGMCRLLWRVGVIDSLPSRSNKFGTCNCLMISGQHATWESPCASLCWEEHGTSVQSSVTVTECGRDDVLMCNSPAPADEWYHGRHIINVYLTSLLQFQSG
jgi:hypothetical protein